jgi:hypothetical protein
MDKMLTWLCSIKPEDDHQAFQTLRVVGTGTWMLHNETYLTWMAVRGSVLWVNGGSRQSCLSAS